MNLACRYVQAGVSTGFSTAFPQRSMACTGPLGAACMCSSLVRQELCDSLYLDDGHTLIVVDAPAEGQADAAGVFRSLASMDVYVRARR
jgi:hypothetical protein